MRARIDQHGDHQLTIAGLGMHRSGSSATADMLIGFGPAGPPLEDLVPAESSNERGRWESREVQPCNAHLLAARDATTYVPPPITTKWNDIAVYETELSEDREATRAYRLTSSLWRICGGTPTPLNDSTTYDEPSS